MAHPVSIADDQVLAVIDRLEAANIAITPNRLRSECGGGNATRYRILIERWRAARSLERASGVRTTLDDSITRVIEVELFTCASFLDLAFRQLLARRLAGQIASGLVRQGLVVAEALGEAPPDPFARFIGDGVRC